MSTGQQLRIAKEEIARIERFLPVMKRVLTMLRMEIRGYRERIDALEDRWQALETEWRKVEGHPFASSIVKSISAEVVKKPESLVGVDVDTVVAVNTHSASDPLFVSSTALTSAIAKLALDHVGVAERLAVERSNLMRLQDAEEEFVFLINGSEQVRLPPLYERLARLERALDEENGMAAAVARILRDRSETTDAEDEELEQWRLFV